MPLMVLLRHDLPDGQWHYDWLFEPADGAAALRSFRVSVRIDLADGPAAFEAVAMADHRRAYLEYEGPVSGDRGTVARVASGTVGVVSDAAGTEGTFTIVVDWGHGPRKLSARHVSGECWCFVVL